MNISPKALPLLFSVEGMNFKYDYVMTELNKAHTAAAISAGLTGTTFMTLFSYLVAEMQRENFKEPQLLATMLRRLVPELNKKYSKIAGWNIHYAVGLAFAIVYGALWQHKKLKPSTKSGLMLGGLSSILAIIVWRSTFLLHPSPPKIHFRRFYGHLFLAHLVFGAFASAGYNFANRNKQISLQTKNTSRL